MSSRSGKGYFYAKGQRAKIQHSWVNGTTEHRFVIGILTRGIRPAWAKKAFENGFYGSDINS
jgi:hypothetical protein